MRAHKVNSNDQKDMRARFVFIGFVFLCLLTGISALQAVSPPMSSADRGTKVVSGETVTPAEWSRYYSSTVGLNNRGTGSYWGQRCGGTLIRRNLVVTAAHCVGRGSRIGKGDYISTGRDLKNPRENLRIAWVKKHPKFAYRYAPAVNGYIPVNDIALVKLRGKVSSSPAISTADMPVAGVELTPGESVTAAGWGDTRRKNRFPRMLQKGVIEVISSTEANTPSSYDGMVRSESMIAAGLMEGGRDTCQGDSGGPLFRFTEDETGKVTRELVGVTSWGYGCAEPGLPGVYTKASAFSNWVERIAAKI